MKLTLDGGKNGKAETFFKAHFSLLMIKILIMKYYLSSNQSNRIVFYSAVIVSEHFRCYRLRNYIGKGMFLILFLVAFLSSCKKDDNSYKKYDKPVWNVDLTGKYPLSMTAVVSIPDNLKAYETTADMVAAFVNGECRGVGTLKETDAGFVYFVMIKGTASEQSNVSFKYYCSRTSYLYTTDGTLTFEVDKTWGSVDSPIVMEMKNVEK